MGKWDKPTRSEIGKNVNKGMQATEEKNREMSANSLWDKMAYEHNQKNNWDEKNHIPDVGGLEDTYYDRMYDRSENYARGEKPSVPEAKPDKTNVKNGKWSGLMEERNKK